MGTWGFGGLQCTVETVGGKLIGLRNWCPYCFDQKISKLHQVGAEGNFVFKNVIYTENAGKQRVVSQTPRFHITLRSARLAVDKEAFCSAAVLDSADITLLKWCSRSRKHLWKYRLTRGWHFAYISISNDPFRRTENTVLFTHTNMHA